MKFNFKTYDCNENDPFKYDKVCKIQEHLSSARPTFFYTPISATHNLMQLAMVYGITEDEVKKLCTNKNKLISLYAIKKYYFLPESWVGKTYAEVGFYCD